MTEKTEYITASIELLEKRDELNSDELAVLCNLKKFMKNDHQPTFAVGEYYADDHGHIVRIDKITIGHITASKLCDGQITQTAFTFWLAQDVLKPATAEQIKEFKLAEAIAKTGQSADQIRQMLSNGKMPMCPWLELQKTAEELQEVGDE